MTLSPLLEKLPPWPQISYALAKQVVQLDIPKSFLTVNEINTFNQALVSLESWKDFIQPTETDSTSSLTAFRVRAMLSEQFIPHCFHSNKPCCQHIKVDLQEVYQQVHLLETREKSPPIPMPIVTAVKQKETEEEQLQPSNTDYVPLLDIYHTLEFDMAAMIEKRKLEEYHAQEEEQAQRQEESNHTTLTILDDTNQFNLKFLLKGIAENRSKTSLSDRDLRNLLSEIKPNRSKWANDDKIGQEDLYEACEKVLTDLKNYTEHSTPFLSKVNKREAPDYFEVIKEPMDLGTVSKKLKNFRYKNKREFGNDLYLIYDNCLTYNTEPGNEYRKHAIAMRRKTDRLMARVPNIVVKERYDMDEMDESEDEEHHHHHHHQRRGSTRERSVTHESEAAEGEMTATSKTSSTKPTLQVVDTTDSEQEIHNELDTDKGELQSQIWREVTKKTRADLTTDVEKQYQFDFGNRYALNRNSLDMERFSRLEHLHHQPETTKKLMRCSRIAFTRWLIHRREEDLNVSVHDEFDLTSEDEEGFDGGFFFSANNKGDNRKTQPTDEDDAIRTDLFLPEYYLGSGLPEIEGIPEEYMPPIEDYHVESDDEGDTHKIPSLDIYPATQLDQTRLGNAMNQNIKTLKRIRSTYDKCNAVRSNIPLAVDKPSIVDDIPSSPEMMDMDTPTPNQQKSSTPIPPLMVNEKAANQMMQRSLVQILTHAGFEGAQSNALNMVTDLVSDYFSNIGKTVRKYLDQHGKTMTGEEILMHTLSENGVANHIHDLNDYITEDIQSYGIRLNDVNRKLEDTYHDLITKSIGEINESNLFENDSEAFVTGFFDEELDEEDFFGFKELGLNKDMRSLRVPLKLWYGKDNPKLICGTKKKDPQHKFSPPPPFIPVTSVAPFVGLLQPWYKKSLEESESSAVTEDEYIPIKRTSRSRYPPVHIKSAYSQHQQQNQLQQQHTTATTKRRVLKDGSNTNAANEEAKHKRKRALEEFKAQKKQQKLEVKAQKLAEKELKKKQREEEKLAKKKASTTTAPL